MRPTVVAERTRVTPRHAARRYAGLLSGILLGAITASLIAAPGLKGLLGAWLAVLMLAIARVDARRYIIPNPLTAAAFGLALLGQAATAPDPAAVAWAVARAATVAVPLLLLEIGYVRYRGRSGLGMGDVKLAAVAGAWLDWLTIAAVIEIACLSAISAYVIHSYRSGTAVRATAALPFGLFLAPAIWLGWLIQTWSIKTSLLETWLLQAWLL